MILEQLPDVGRLSSEDKLLLAAELIKDAAPIPDEPVDPALAELLRRRLDDYLANPDAVSSWEDVKRRVLSSR